jgi:16S rRNA (guanine527-N7)-methyltransferase
VTTSQLDGLDADALAGHGIWSAPAKRLAAGLEQMGLSVDQATQGRLLAYLALLARWSKTYNLTAVTEPMAMVDRHLLDSLSICRAVLEFAPRGWVVDAGTGAGLPGLVLALVGVGEHWALVDSNGKKIRFVRQVCRAFGLDSVQPIQGRVESLILDEVPRVVVARALAPLERLVDWTAHWLAEGTVLLAMKADLQESEILAVSPSYNVSVRALDSTEPGVQRCLAVVRLDEPAK